MLCQASGQMEGKPLMFSTRGPGGSLRAGWLAGYLRGAGIQGRVSSPYNVHLSGALKTSHVERSEARVAPRRMEGRARAG